MKHAILTNYYTLKYEILNSKSFCYTSIFFFTGNQRHIHRTETEEYDFVEGERGTEVKIENLKSKLALKNTCRSVNQMLFNNLFEFVVNVTISFFSNVRKHNVKAEQ